MYTQSEHTMDEAKEGKKDGKNIKASRRHTKIRENRFKKVP